jgi:hypothetical protein
VLFVELQCPLLLLMLLLSTLPVLSAAIQMMMLVWILPVQTAAANFCHLHLQLQCCG